MMSRMPGLELVGLAKSYGGHPAVRDVDLTIGEGRFVCFLGPSGCGKTTLLRMIAGLEQPDRGSIRLFGRDITPEPAHRRNFGMVFQALALFPHMNVGENIGYALRLQGRSRRDRRESVRALLEMIDLPGIEDRRVDQLSGGQRQRVAIARALAQEPRLFLMDEPLSALDAKLRDRMQVEIRQLQRKMKITTIFVTHDQREAMTIADDIVVMAGGRIQQVGSPVDVYRRPVNRFVADFIGRSNLLTVDVAGPDTVRFRGIVAGPYDLPDGIPEGSTATLCLRPEDLDVVPLDGGHSDAMPAEVQFARELGGSVELELSIGDDLLIASLPPSRWAGLRAATAVGIRFEPGAGSILSDGEARS